MGALSKLTSKQTNPLEQEFYVRTGINVDHSFLGLNTHLAFEKRVQLVSLCSLTEVYKINQLKSLKQTELKT